MPDWRSQFELSTLGYASCYAEGDKRSITFKPTTFQDHVAYTDTYASASFVSFKNGHTRQYALRIMHLARRLSACHAADSSGDSCLFSAVATAELRAVIVEREFAVLNPDPDAKYSTSAYWGFEQSSDGCCGYVRTNALYFDEPFSITFDTRVGGSIWQPPNARVLSLSCTRARVHILFEVQSIAQLLYADIVSNDGHVPSMCVCCVRACMRMLVDVFAGLGNCYGIQALVPFHRHLRRRSKSSKPFKISAAGRQAIVLRRFLRIGL